MKDKILFSVVIPVFKVEKYIEECVKSIIRQNFSNFEVILIDDGSPDNCPAICDKLMDMDTRIKVIHKKNGGVGSARKEGAMIARGEYIFCVDGDDWIGLNCFKRIAEVIYETNADIICYGSFVDNGKNIKESELPYREGLYSREDIQKAIFPILIQKSDASYFAPGVCGKAIRRNMFLDNVLADKRAVFGEDGACVIPCVFQARSMYILKESFYYYRYNTESTTKGKKVFNWECVKVRVEHVSSKIDIQYGDFEEQLNRMIVHEIFSTVVSRFNQKKPYIQVFREVKEHLKEPCYADAIVKAHFSGSLRARVMLWAVRYKCLFAIGLYAKWK